MADDEATTTGAGAGGRTASGRRRQQRRADHPLAAVHQAHPRFLTAVREDARVAAAFRAERHRFTSRADTALQVARLAWVSDAFFAQICYRAKASLQARGVPILPRLAHRLAMSIAQICIGDPVVVGPGLYLPHGQVVIDGVTTIDRGVTIRPWVTIGLRDGDFTGAHIEHHVRIGTGAKIIGPVHIGARSNIGANAVVLIDVPPDSVAAGVPARIIRTKAPSGPT